MLPLKNTTVWLPQNAGKATVLVAGTAFLVDQSGNFLVDQAGDFLVSTPNYVVPLNATVWVESSPK